MGRIAAILQLCFVFTIIFWIASYPFMGQMMAHKKQSFLFQSVKGTGDLVNRTYFSDADALDKLKRNQERYLSLPIELRTEIESRHHEQTNVYNETTFFDKLTQSLKLLTVEIPPFERAWIFFAILVSVLVLTRSPGVIWAVWLLPIIVCIAGIDNQLNGSNRVSSEEAKLFPTEDYLIANYIGEPLADQIFAQQDQLKGGWHKYLVSEWLHLEPALNPDVFAEQVEEGEFLFNLARLKASLNERSSNLFFYRKESPALWFLYFIWNLFFAWAAWRDPKSLRYQAAIANCIQ